MSAKPTGSAGSAESADLTYGRAFFIRLLCLAAGLILTGVSLQILSSSAISLISGLFPEIIKGYGEVVDSITGGFSLPSLITLLLLAPIAEEIMFRGLLQGFMLKYLPIHAAVILQAVAFGLFHGNIVQFVYATLIGILQGYLTAGVYICTVQGAHPGLGGALRIILPSAFLHFVINLSGVLLPQDLFATKERAALLLAVSAATVTIIIFLAIKFFNKSVKTYFDA